MSRRPRKNVRQIHNAAFDGRDTKVRYRSAQKRIIDRLTNYTRIFLNKSTAKYIPTKRLPAYPKYGPGIWNLPKNTVCVTHFFVGVFTNKKEHYQYVIFADLIKSEIVFRNLKFVKGGPAGAILNPLCMIPFLSLYP